MIRWHVCVRYGPARTCARALVRVCLSLCENETLYANTCAAIIIRCVCVNCRCIYARMRACLCGFESQDVHLHVLQQCDGLSVQIQVRVCVCACVTFVRAFIWKIWTKIARADAVRSCIICQT